MYNFIEVHKECQAEVYLKIQSNGRKPTNNSSKVKSNVKAKELVRREEKLSRLDYLKTVGSKFQIKILIFDYFSTR